MQVFKSVSNWGAVFFAIALSLVWAQWDQYYKDRVRAEEFFFVKTLYVPDHFDDSNEPWVISYERVISNKFFGHWIIEITTADTNVITCTGSGDNVYEPTAQLPAIVTVDWLMGKKCILPNGPYKMTFYMIIKQPGWPDKYYEKSSNIFEIKELKKGAS